MFLNEEYCLNQYLTNIPLSFITQPRLLTTLKKIPLRSIVGKTENTCYQSNTDKVTRNTVNLLSANGFNSRDLSFVKE